jgi:maltooligosyltrehalose synthase
MQIAVEMEVHAALSTTTRAKGEAIDKAIAAREALLQAEIDREAKQAARIAALEAEIETLSAAHRQMAQQLATARDKAWANAEAELSALMKRDAVTRDKALEEAAAVADECVCGSCGLLCLEAADAIRALKTANETRTKAGE